MALNISIKIFYKIPFISNLNTHKKDFHVELEAAQTFDAHTIASQQIND